MKKNMMRRNLTQSIKKSLARYIAIVAIIALGAGMFVGLRTTKSDMVATGQRFMDEQNMFDLRLLSTYGWDKEDVEEISRLDGVVDAEGVISMDVIASYEGAETESVYKVYSIPEKVNQVYLHGGRMPQAPDECLADGFHATDAILGKQITISETNDADTLDCFAYRTYTVVGYVSTPLYMDMSRGNTSLGNGTISAYLYIPEESFTVDYYTEINITLPGEHEIYTDDYDEFVQSYADRLTPQLQPIAQQRYESVLADGEQAYSDGLAEFEEGWAEYEKGRAEAEAELADAEKQLLDGQKQIEENRQTIETGLAELETGQAQIDANRKTLLQSKVALAQAKAETFSKLATATSDLMGNYKLVNSSISQVQSGIDQIDAGLSQIDSGISQLESGISQLDTMISVSETLLNVASSGLSRAESALEAAKNSGADPELIAQLEASVQELKQQVSDYETQLAQMKQSRQEYSAQLDQLKQQREELVTQRAALETTLTELQAALAQIDQGFVELEASQKQAENEFAAAEAQLEAAELQLDAAQAELDKGRQELEEGQKQLQQAEADLETGWKEYYEAEETALAELADAEQQLLDAKAELEDARKTLDSMSDPDVYALARTTNVGYLALDSNSDIVEGVSTVFPAFFLLIAALVCITTMTRMVEDERTQIGTLKALGYGNGAIIGKYLAYAGSAAVLGCGLGVVIGSIVFPLILWEAYQILMFLGNYFVLQMDWGLCLLVLGMYTAVTLLVTWYCAHRSLREVPAELIRPKPPTSGKKIFLEKLPFWNRFSFLNKVMLRNIFRYRQRLLMMLVGIGGCTALLLTGFGIRDSIGDLADHQFSEVILYDLEIRFSGNQTQEQQESFRESLEGQTEAVFFYHQSSMELEFDDHVHDITLIAAEEGISDYINLRNDSGNLSYPGSGEALISVGVAEKMGISTGDTILVRDGSLRVLELRVTGIFNNNVYNYVIVQPQTIQLQWEETPQQQMACVEAAEGVDVHELGAAATEAEGVMSVTVNADVASQVGKMLEALDLVVITVVICAALLAIIVLYNLTNINITERIREIATIKVLGFNSGESAAYVFKENLLLSAMGAVLGLGGGIFLLEFVMSQIQVDMVWMTARLQPMSFVWALIITMLAACAVDFILYFKLEKINMAEALKSVE